ncbi:MAG: DUF4349 domain-containing protein [Clostridiales bacterium]|nr:DUF4349 domain-containing protein [Clostridiales bacterium]
MKKKLVIMAGILVITALITGCGNSGSKAYDTAVQNAGGAAYNNASYTTSATADMLMEPSVEYETADYMTEESAVAAEAGGAQVQSEEVSQSQRKLIKTVSLNAETEEYDALIAGLEAQIKALGGYIEYQYQYNGSGYSDYTENRHANMQIRIPVNNLDSFIEKVGEQTNITNKEEQVEDVTLRYVDLESHKKTLVTEQDRLLDLLEVAETVEDIITIEQRLSDVRYQLESMESQLRTLDNQIDYSTINLTIREVKRYTLTEEKTVWDKIRNGFSNSIYNIGQGIVNFFIWFVVNIPYIIIWAVVIFVAFMVIRFVMRKRKAKKALKVQQPQNMSMQPQNMNIPPQNQKEEEK